jgi:hypothetical protein
MIHFFCAEFDHTSKQGGCCYQQQLQIKRVKHPDVYLIEKILRRKNNKVFVKWLGFDLTHNSWIDKKQTVEKTPYW